MFGEKTLGKCTFYIGIEVPLRRSCTSFSFFQIHIHLQFFYKVEICSTDDLYETMTSEKQKLI